MMRNIKRSLSGNLSPLRVRFAPESKTTISTESMMSRTEGEGSTMGGDTISSASTVDSMSEPIEYPTFQTGDSVDFEGVAVESFRALALSACLVSETVFELGAELSRMPHHCGFDSSVDTSENGKFVAVQHSRSRSRDRIVGTTEADFSDDSSIASNPPSRKKRRRPFGFFGLSNRAKKNYEKGLPQTVTTNTEKADLPATPPKKKVTPKKPATPKVVTPPRQQTPKRVRDSKRLLTGCFVKKPNQTDDDTDAVTVSSRYRTEHEDMQLMAASSVYTIRMTRVPSGELDEL